MNMTQWRPWLAAFALLLTISACVLPGQTAPSAPTADTVLLSTMIAERVSAARTQTAAPPVQASETQVVGTPMPTTGTKIEKAADGSTIYTDYEAGFEVSLPVGWLAVRPNSDESAEALANAGANNQMLYDQLTVDLADYEAGIHRLYCYPLRPDIQENVIFGFSTLSWDLDATLDQLDDNALGDLVTYLEGPEGIPGFQAVTAQLSANGNGVSVIKVAGPFEAEDGQGISTEFYGTLFSFKPSPDSLVIWTFTIVRDYQDSISADLESVLASLKLLE